MSEQTEIKMFAESAYCPVHWTNHTLLSSEPISEEEAAEWHQKHKDNGFPCCIATKCEHEWTNEKPEFRHCPKCRLMWHSRHYYQRVARFNQLINGAASTSDKLKVNGYFEDYRCGCVSETVRRKRDLLGYCPKHGEDRREIWPDVEFPKEAASTSEGGTK